jgi:hypothetical protein
MLISQLPNFLGKHQYGILLSHELKLADFRHLASCLNVHPADANLADVGINA